MARTALSRLLTLLAGATVFVVIGTARIDQFGRAHAVLDDIDGDGVRDVAVSGRRSARGGPRNHDGRVEIRSGRTGELLRSFPGFVEDEEFGEFLSVLADRDGDGFSELLVGTRDGRVYAVSPATGDHWDTLREYEPLGSSVGGNIVPIVDHDGDGYQDFVRTNVAAIVPRPGERSEDGSLGLHSGRPG